MPPDRKKTAIKEPEVISDEIKATDLSEQEQAKIVMSTMKYQGPLPPASEFSKYDKALPGSAKKILNSMLKEQSFRHDMTKASLTLEAKEIQRGQYLGFTLLLTFLAGSLWCVSINQTIIAGIMLSSVVIGVVGKFIPKLIGRDK